MSNSKKWQEAKAVRAERRRLEFAEQRAQMKKEAEERQRAADAEHKKVQERLERWHRLERSLGGEPRS